MTSCHYIHSTSHHIYVPFRSIKKIKHWHDDFCYTCNGMTSHVHRCLWTYAQLIGVCLCVPRSWHIGTGHWKQASVRFTSMINFILREHFCELKSPGLKYIFQLILILLGHTPKESHFLDLYYHDIHIAPYLRATIPTKVSAR